MKKKYNEQFIILSAIGIILVMFGHLNLPILSFHELLPYYSYHVMLFVFISGYFYHPEEETHIYSYIKRKFARLILPYMGWNLFYGIIITCIHKWGTAGITFGENISLYNYFIAPFLSGHQYMLHAAAWFVPALFLLQLCNIIGRKFLSLLRIKNEYMITVLYFLIGFTVVYLAKRGSVYDYYKLPGRLMLMAPMFQLGHLYHTHLEKRDTLPSVPYFLILTVLQFLVMYYTHGAVNYSVVWVTGFANGVVMPFITATIGILFWLRISRLLQHALQKKLPPVIKWLKNFLYWTGTHTYGIMMHHLFGFFLFNELLSLLHNRCSLLSLFEMERFQGDIYYTYCASGGNPVWYLGYLIFGFLAAWLLDKTGKLLYGTIRNEYLKLSCAKTNKQKEG